MSIRRSGVRAVLAVGLAGAMALTGCAPRQGEPMNQSTASPPGSGQRDAQSIRQDFLDHAGRMAILAGDTWTYMDDATFPADDGGSFMPQPCTAKDDGPRQLRLMLKSGPREDGPGQIEAIKGKLEAEGLTLTSYIPGGSAHEVSTVGATGSGGKSVVFSTNDTISTLQLTSECSTDASMRERVG